MAADNKHKGTVLKNLLESQDYTNLYMGTEYFSVLFVKDIVELLTRKHVNVEVPTRQAMVIQQLSKVLRYQAAKAASRYEAPRPS